MNKYLYNSTMNLNYVKYSYTDCVKYDYVKYNYFESVVSHLLNSIKILEDRIKELEKKVN
ncbi:MAG: hypothetical protein N3A58_00010 [Spirochaetes bacterium]|nr:hypothetical protein [Spirochaetota bacterium]